MYYNGILRVQDYGKKWYKNDESVGNMRSTRQVVDFMKPQLPIYKVRQTTNALLSCHDMH